MDRKALGLPLRCFLVEPVEAPKPGQEPQPTDMYRGVDGGDAFPLEKAPPGAMLWAWWTTDLHPQLGEHPLVVILPDGVPWMPDAQAHNCSIPDDVDQARHHCWVMHGTPPAVTVDKDGVTCDAGHASVSSPGYHGDLRDGFFT
jgi:hypothetical protein